MNLNKFVSAGLLAASILAAPAAQAAFITGSASVTGFFQNNTTALGAPTSLVSTLSSFDLLATALVGAASGDLVASAGAGVAYDFTNTTVPQLMYTLGNLTFTVNQFGAVRTTAFSCTNGQCSDAISFAAQGVAVGGGFEPTDFSMSWSAQGSCNESMTVGGQCGASTTASWSASISANGVPPVVPQAVPEPGSLALAGLALLGLVAASRRKSV